MSLPSWSPALVGAAAAALASTAFLSFKFVSKGSLSQPIENGELIVSRIKHYCETILLDKDRLKNISKDFIQQLETGLERNVEVDGKHMLMLPTHLTQLPTGHEQGECYAIDIGGTNFRVMYLKLADSKNQIHEKDVVEVSLPRDLLSGDGSRLFDFLAVTLRDFIAKHRQELSLHKPHASVQVNPQSLGTVDISATSDNISLPVVGFCFSFPVSQTSANSGILLDWTKGFTCSGVVGEDPVTLLHAALIRAGCPCHIAVLLNDTIGVMASHQYINSSTSIGVILGTGTNACYVEKTSRLKKWRLSPLPSTSSKTVESPTSPSDDSAACDTSLNSLDNHTAVNIEWGSFYSPLLPLSEEDKAMDSETSQPGKFLFEKVLSGLYLGDLARRMINRIDADSGFKLFRFAREGKEEKQPVEGKGDFIDAKNRKCSKSHDHASNHDMPALKEGSFLTKHLSTIVDALLLPTLRLPSNATAAAEEAEAFAAVLKVAESGNMDISDPKGSKNNSSYDHSEISHHDWQFTFLNSKSLAVTERILRDVALGDDRLSDYSLAAVQIPRSTLVVVEQVCLLVARRSAQLLSMGLLSILKHVDWLKAEDGSEGEVEERRRTTTKLTSGTAASASLSQSSLTRPSLCVAFDGGVYKNFATYRLLVQQELALQIGFGSESILPHLHLEMSDGGSCLGAAVLAAAASQ